MKYIKKPVVVEAITFDELVDALKHITFIARTSGGTPGPDAELMAACERAEATIATCLKLSAEEDTE